MALPDSNISITLVGNTLGSSSRDVGTLCTHPNINKWSLWKPIASNKLVGLSLPDIIASNCGLSRTVINTITYERPRGGNPHNEHFRLGDFRNYNHQARPPVYPEIVKVVGPGDVLIPGPPYQLVEAMPYYIYFKLKVGDIDPEWIDSRTVRVKNTNLAGGYGGVTWVMEQSGAYEYTRNPDEVFSAVLEPINNETEHVQGIIAKSVTDGLRMEYVRYEGSSTNKYKTMNLFIEDDYNDFSYRKKFEFKYLSAGIASIDFLSFIASNLDVRISVVNDESFPLNVRIRMNYKRVETGNEYTYTGNIQTLGVSTSAQWFVGPMSGWSDGLNTYEVRTWMYYVNPVDSSEIEIDYKQKTLSVTISGSGI